MMQFLVTLTMTVPAGTSESAVAEAKVREAQRAGELAEQGHLLRLWTPPADPGQWRVLGLWSAGDPPSMQAILQSLPLYSWAAVEILPLSPHPSDPALAAA
jgi:muconolactone D-isomerase